MTSRGRTGGDDFQQTADRAGRDHRIHSKGSLASPDQQFLAISKASQGGHRPVPVKAPGPEQPVTQADGAFVRPGGSKAAATP